MVRAVLSLALLAGTAAEVPSCQQDETTLLQGAVGFRNAHSLHHSHAVQLESGYEGIPDDVVGWVDNNTESATEWVGSNKAEAAQWANANPEDAQELFDNHPDFEELIFGTPPGLWPEGILSNLRLLEGTTCLDGTRAGYYSRLGSSGANGTWVIWIEGGGGCSSATDCEENWLKGQSTYWKQGIKARGVQSGSCQNNPDFCEANQVLIKYCTGDKHQGQRADPHDGPRPDGRDGFYTSGHLNFQAITEDLISHASLGTATRVLLTGTSAGGVGVISNADYLKDTLQNLNQNVIVKAAPIAGWFMPDFTEDHPDETWMMVSSFEDHKANTATDSQEALAHWTVEQAWSNATQGNCPDGDHHGVKCQNVPTRAAHVQTPMLVSENMWDSFHMESFGVDKNSSTWSDDHKLWLNYIGRAMRNSTEHWVSQRGGIDGLFVPGTISHGGDVGGGSSSARIDGHSYFEVLADWFFEQGNLDSHAFIDACASVEACNLV